ncbi:MAG: hypothetical protein IPM70_07775 [Proteobacteria bacterium]|nr:hypothetical protein [Pseudomonadota bacterium]
MSSFEGIQKLESGSTLTLNAEALRQRKVPVAQRYWEPASLVRARSDSDPSQLEEVLRRAVASRLVSDVPLGAFLSGGVDSTLVTALMKQLAGTVRTFTIGFDESPMSEVRHASEVARYLGTSHEELILTPEHAADLVPQVVAAYDEPFADASAVPTWLVSQLAARDVKVVLSGDGADENFGGYTRYALNARIWRLRRYFPGAFRWLLGKVSASMLTGPTASRASSIAWSLLSDDVVEYTRRRTSFFLNPALLLPGVQEIMPQRLQLVSQTESVVRSMMLADMVTYLPDDILTKVDRASMAHGLEVRSPFIDDDVVEFAWGFLQERSLGRTPESACSREYLYRLSPHANWWIVPRRDSASVEQWLRGE